MFRLRLFLLVTMSVFSAVPVSAHAFDFSFLMKKIDTLREAFFVPPLSVGLTQGTQPYQVVYVPALKQPRWVHAQTAGFGGGSGMLVTHYREVTPPGGSGAGGTAAACPSGWTTALHGYGPHYIGITTYGLLVSGVEQGWTDPWWYPGDPGGSYSGPGGEVPPDSGDPADPPPPPEPGTPHGGGGNNGGGGVDGGEPADPPPPPEPPGPETPGGGYPEPPTGAPGGGNETFLPTTKKNFAVSQKKNTWRLIKVALAQTLPTGQEYFTKDVAIGSDDRRNHDQAEAFPPL